MLKMKLVATLVPVFAVVVALFNGVDAQMPGYGMSPYGGFGAAGYAASGAGYPGIPMGYPYGPMGYPFYAPRQLNPVMGLNSHESANANSNTNVNSNGGRWF